MSDRAQHIISQVTPMLMRFGAKNLTMDEIAKNLGISKKTLYQVVSDKADLVEKAVSYYMDFEMKAMETIHAESENAIEELVAISKHMSKHLSQMHPSIVHDLQKYYPRSYRLFEAFKQDCATQHVMQNLRNGMDQGYYRDNLNIPIIAKFYMARIDMIFDTHNFPHPEFDIKQVFFESIRYHIRGVANEKGVAYLKEHFTENDMDNPIF